MRPSSPYCKLSHQLLVELLTSQSKAVSFLGIVMASSLDIFTLQGVLLLLFAPGK